MAPLGHPTATAALVSSPPPCSPQRWPAAAAIPHWLCGLVGASWGCPGCTWRIPSCRLRFSRWPCHPRPLGCPCFRHPRNSPPHHRGRCATSRVSHVQVWRCIGAWPHGSIGAWVRPRHTLGSHRWGVWYRRTSSDRKRPRADGQRHRWCTLRRHGLWSVRGYRGGRCGGRGLGASTGRRLRGGAVLRSHRSSRVGKNIGRRGGRGEELEGGEKKRGKRRGRQRGSGAEIGVGLRYPVRPAGLPATGRGISHGCPPRPETFTGRS